LSYQPTAKMKRTLNVWVLLVLIAFACSIVVNLFKISITDNEKYQVLANENQFGSTIVKANRGSIYDANGKILAQSATVYSIIINPNALLQVSKNSGTEEFERQRDAAATILSEELSEVTYDEVVKKFEKTTVKWVCIKKQVEKPVADRILERADEEKLVGNLIYTEQDTKRYYPQGELAAAVIGFTNYEGNGIYGIESYYNEYLAGVDGKVISATDAQGNAMPYKNDKIYAAQDGNSVYLTIDMTLQYYVERELEKAVETYNAQNRACSIMMNAKTGAILAMATTPGYDLNDRNSIFSKKDQDILAAITDEEEYKKTYEVLREQQWKNKAITELYYPGSVFKVVTGSSALEEKAISLDTIFVCNRTYTVAGTEFHCWANYSHGAQNFAEAMAHSCNPAFIQIGEKLGAENFSKYFEAYGLTEPTGIDLPGEATSIYVHPEDMGPVELASCSFGQSNKITPMQMITAYAAVVNGGYLLTPYVVSKIVDPNGNVVKKNEPKIKRQVISEETSKIMREVLESVVNTNGSKNAYIEGYKIGGKSGTSQKQDENNAKGVENLYVSSYCGFAPADDPEIIMLVMVDTPTGSEYYGSVVAAPVVSNVFKEALPYLGYYPEYTDEELANMDVTVPSVEGQDTEKAKQTLNALKLNVKVIGNGNYVISQVPAAAQSVPRNGKVILYTEENYAAQDVAVPNLTGKSLTEVNQILAEADLNFRPIGGASGSTGATATWQNYGEGCIVPVGTVIEVEFVVKNEG
jgi:stage V sporulation protein D (sporulation-specific penicillin-binding protein)